MVAGTQTRIVTTDDSLIQKIFAAGNWESLLMVLLDHDMYLIRPFSRIRDHPCWTPFLQLLQENKAEAIARLIGYLENYDVRGQWSLILLPDLTGENPVPEGRRGIDELFLELEDWIRWARRKKIEPIL